MYSRERAQHQNQCAELFPLWPAIARHVPERQPVTVTEEDLTSRLVTDHHGPERSGADAFLSSCSARVLNSRNAASSG